MSKRRGWWQRVLCGLNGHDLMRSFEPGRICLRCVSCNYETRGWTLKERAPVPRPAERLLKNAA
jgi:hypothetical protein